MSEEKITFEPNQLHNDDNTISAQHRWEDNGPAGTHHNDGEGKTEEELMREVSFIEFYKYELKKLRETVPPDSLQQAEKRLCEEVVQQLTNFHKQKVFNNKSISGMARNLESVDSVFQGEPMIPEDMTLADFSGALVAFFRKGLGSAAGTKPHLALVLYLAALTASDVTNRKNGLSVRISGLDPMDKLWVKSFMSELFPEAVSKNLTCRFDQADTIGEVDKDCVISIIEKEPNQKHKDIENIHCFKEVATSGRVFIRRASISGKKCRVTETVIPSKMACIILSEDPSLTSGVKSRILDINIDPETPTGQEESTDEFYRILRKVTPLVNFYNILESIGFFPSPPMQSLIHTIECIEKEQAWAGAFAAIPNTMSSLSRKMPIARALAVVKGVIEVTSPLQHSEEISKPEPYPTADLFEAISRRMLC